MRDTHRNNTLRRVVTNDNKEKPLMFFETTIWYLFVYNPEERALCGMTENISYWFAKRDSQHMLPEEKDFLQKFSTWRPVEKWKDHSFIYCGCRLKKGH